MKRSEMINELVETFSKTPRLNDMTDLWLAEAALECIEKKGMMPPSTDKTKELSALYYGYRSFRDLQQDQGTDEDSIEFNYYEPEDKDISSGSHYEGTF